MGLTNLKTKLGYAPGGRPGNFELGANSTIHNVSSTRNRPPFSTYASPYLRSQRPVDPSFLFPEKPKKYLDNPPK